MLPADAPVKNAPAEGASRRARRASSETISASVPESAATPSPAPDAPLSATPSTATVSRRAARAAAANPETADAATSDAAASPAAASARAKTDAPDAVAASSVATLRPHAQKVGRRAADAFSDQIEKPAGGRRAIVSAPTTALPIDDSRESATPVASAATVDVEIVVAEVLEQTAGGAAPISSTPISSTASGVPIVETAAIPIIETGAPIPPAAMAADDVVVPVKPVSRRTLRTAAIAPTDAAGAGSGPAQTTGSGAGHADDAKPPTGRRSRRNLAKGAFSALALVFATGIAVATTMPAEALHAASENQHTSILATEQAAEPALPGQELTTSSEAAGASIARDGYSVRDTAALKAAGFRIADTFTNNPRGAIQWPFPVGVPISDGFGARESPGGIGSTDHKGVDFAPGQGTPIQSIADGVVSSVQPYDDSGLGVHVIIDHVVDGQKVSSVYGHMLTGSIQVTEGQVVKVAQTVGLVGNTGASTGPHLHLEIRLDGVTPVDPFAWLQTHAV
ncbi:Murein DD-endopeptidase MepM and murein hydrolase activator NlpD, contain LysM domain [Herbiconiux ginsengi]|uniref:Murein DD-endopeptidase MepM and murein hydrolase activator NlpD, contain LysM domain n=1 Tax=Herbiconiux ginsengi TaxID=381665 RepID=A0A1H3NCQ1_9MICO|nr:Murein DD-endopeptidase MepM and murein hydrolase activator NlpD, contain LysM domain [Herbiconiux ginsengi]